MLNPNAMKLRKSLILGLVSVSFISASIVSEQIFAKDSKESKAVKAPKASPKASKDQKTEKAKSGVAQFKIGTKGDEYYFDKDKITAKAGQQVQIIFTNTSSPTSALQHNLVVVKPGLLEKVANEGIQAGADKGWVPTGSPDVVAATKLMNPGQSETITFQAPSEPGDYPYLCTFPGHSTTMKGVLKVTK